MQQLKKKLYHRWVNRLSSMTTPCKENIDALHVIPVSTTYCSDDKTSFDRIGPANQMQIHPDTTSICRLWCRGQVTPTSDTIFTNSWRRLAATDRSWTLLGNCVSRGQENTLRRAKVKDKENNTETFRSVPNTKP